MVVRWQEEAVQRLRLAKEAGELERERRQVRQSILDPSQNLTSALGAREQHAGRTLSPAELREKARAQPKHAACRSVREHKRWWSIRLYQSMLGKWER